MSLPRASALRLPRAGPALLPTTTTRGAARGVSRFVDSKRFVPLSATEEGLRSRSAYQTGITGIGKRESSSMSNISALQTIRQNARKVVCIGRNYADHVTELNNQRPKQSFYFLKPTSSILLPDEGPVLRPEGINMHHEIELGLVIGKKIHDLKSEDDVDVLQYIDSYLLTIDMTGRNVQEEAKKKGYPWSIAKGYDTFLPIAGPISKEKLTKPHEVEIYLKVNGETRQQDNTELMLFRIPRQLSDISQAMTLEPGDIVLTGTPKGVGPVKSGDIMEAGLKINGEEVEEAKMRVEVKDKGGNYVYSET